MFGYIYSGFVMHPYYPSRLSLAGRRRHECLRAVALALALLVACALAGCAHLASDKPASAHQSTQTSEHSATSQAASSLRNLRLEPAQGDLVTHAEIEHGKASYYGPRFAGRLTASGQRFNPKLLTAAHRSLPFGTRVRVTNLNNGKQAVVRINDRGPFVAARIIDLSRHAARLLGMLKSGVAPVR